MGAGEGHRGEMANPAWASHRDPRCLQGWTLTCQVSKTNAAAPLQPPTRSRATQSHPVPGAAAPGSPLAHPRAGAACREHAAEWEQCHQHQPSPAQPGTGNQAQHPLGTASTQQPHAPDGLTRMPARRVWHHGLAWATLTHSMGGSCPSRCPGHSAPWHEPRTARPGRSCPSLLGCWEQVGQELVAPLGQP